MESGRGDCIFEANRTFQSKLHNFFPPFSRLLFVLLDQFFDEVYLPRTRIWAINTRFDVIACGAERLAVANVDEKSLCSSQIYHLYKRSGGRQCVCLCIWAEGAKGYSK